ncbi:MAG: flavodoxin family protein [Proteobacteria bacterium]|nr:flavodoxin family protein [Pseudomonadota bacterium]MBU4471212.1 flavodoxin family protein [Pseudomonadota bacterium]MCG2753187.1 flavodoxin family protein [Desulfobacteraceae bacterium]
MQILILSGSRNRNGQTARAIQAITKGISEAGGQSETLFLPELSLERCRQCDPDGWGLCRHEGRCVIEDDFSSATDKVKAADVVVFANPVYFGDLSDSMKCFLDRIRRVVFFKMISGGRGASSEFAKPAIGYCYAGGSGNGTTSCSANLERILQTCGFDVVDMINARRQNLDAKIPMLELTGRWLVTKPASGPRFVPPGR